MISTLASAEAEVIVTSQSMAPGAEPPAPVVAEEELSLLDAVAPPLPLEVEPVVSEPLQAAQKSRATMDVRTKGMDMVGSPRRG